MSLLRLVISTLAIIASSAASGIGHLLQAPVIKSVPIVRYAPFYNFPTGVRSIHAVAPFAAGLPVGPPPVVPAQFAGPVLPPPAPASFLPAPLPAVAPAPVFSGPAFHAPAFAAPAYPAPAFPAPVFPPPAFPAPSFPAPAFSAAPAPVFPSLLPKFAPFVPALPAVAPLYARALQAPFAPIVRAVAPALPSGPHLFAPAAVAPASFAVARTLPFGVSPYANHLHVHNKFLAPPVLQAPFIKQAAWK